MTPFFRASCAGLLPARSFLRAVDTLQAEGWQFYTVSELAKSAGAELTPGGVYSSFPPKAKD